MKRCPLVCLIRCLRRLGGPALVLAGSLLVSCGGSDPFSSGGGAETGNQVEEKEPAVAVSGTVTHNLPGLPFTVSKDAEVADLDLLSSNLVRQSRRAIVDRAATGAGRAA